MRIDIWTEIIPEHSKWLPDKYIGGTIEFWIKIAESLKSMGHEIYIYYDDIPMFFNGVYYLPRSCYIGGDITLSCNSFIPKKGKYNIYWTSWVHQKDYNCMDFNERIVISNYHKSIFGDNCRVIYLGYDPKQFNDGKKIKKIKGKCLYSSSPDRGGAFLKNIWDDVKRETGAELICTYNRNKFITEDEMIEHYYTSEFWLHPCQGIELFCASGMKAQLSGCIPVVIPNMALSEVIKYGIKSNIENYKSDLINAIKNPPSVENVRFDTWDEITKDLFKNIL